MTIFKVPDPGSVTDWFFWCGVGLLPGFNERWANNLFTKDADPLGRSQSTAKTRST